MLGDDDQVFAPAAVSFHRNAAILSTDDCYMQARPTDWQPLTLPKHPRRIVSVGSCPFFDYSGTGLIDLRIDGRSGQASGLSRTWIACATSCGAR